MGTQQFCLRWNNHQTNMLNVFDQLLQSEDFVDVTLACEGVSIKAHKMVLASCSPYFQSLFKENPCKHPIVILKDMKFAELRLIVDFMYKGEINVSQDQLSTLLKTADDLKVKGLAEVSSGAMSHSGGENRDGGGGGAGGDDANDAVNATNSEDTATTQGQTAGSPQSQDGRASPHSRRKRHRPNRRPSNSDNDNDPLIPESSEICFETIDEPEPKIRPKNEPVELFSEPPVELLMETNPCFDMDISADRNNRTQSTTRDMHSTMPSDRLSQPSTSGTQQMSNQDLESGCRSRKWKHSDMTLAINAVKDGVGIKTASKQYGIPTMTLWRWTQKCGVTSVYGGRKMRVAKEGTASAALAAAAAAVASSSVSHGSRQPPLLDESSRLDLHLKALLNPYAHSGLRDCASMATTHFDSS